MANSWEKCWERAPLQIIGSAARANKTDFRGFINGFSRITDFRIRDIV